MPNRSTAVPDANMKGMCFFVYCRRCWCWTRLTDCWIWDSKPNWIRLWDVCLDNDAQVAISVHLQTLPQPIVLHSSIHTGLQSFWPSLIQLY